MQEKLLHTEKFVISPKESGGEALIFITEYYDNGDKEIFTNQRIVLHSYCNNATINLYGIQITSDILRELANKLDEAKIIATSKL